MATLIRSQRSIAPGLEEASPPHPMRSKRTHAKDLPEQARKKVGSCPKLLPVTCRPLWTCSSSSGQSVALLDRHGKKKSHPTSKRQHGVTRRCGWHEEVAPHQGQ